MLDGLTETLLSLVILTEPKQRIAEAVVQFGLPRTKMCCATVTFRCPRVIDRLLIQCAKIVMCFQEIRFQPDSLVQMNTRFIKLTELPVDGTQVIVRVDVVWFENNYLSIGIGSLLKGAQLVVSGGEHEPSFNITPVNAARLFEERNGLYRLIMP